MNAVDFYENWIDNTDREKACAQHCNCHGGYVCLIEHDSTHPHIGRQDNGDLIQWTCEVRDAEQPAD